MFLWWIFHNSASPIFTVVTVSIQEPSYSVSEESGVVEVCVEMEDGLLNGVNVTVRLKTVSGTAQESGRTQSFAV